MTTQVLLGAVLIGFGVGFLSGAFGKGGSAIATPLLHMLGVPAIVAIASPLPATIPSTWFASRVYARSGDIDARVVRVGVAVGVPATVAGAWLTRWIPGGPLVIATDVVVLAFGLRMLLTQTAPETRAEEHHARPARILAVVGIVGFISGLLGNSGGFLLAPLFISALGMPIHRAFGTSLVLATCLAIPGTLVHAMLGHIDWTLTLAFGLATVPAATFGARLALRTRDRPLRLAYGAGITMLAAGLLAFAH